MALLNLIKWTAYGIVTKKTKSDNNEVILIISRYPMLWVYFRNTLFSLMRTNLLL